MGILVENVNAWRTAEYETRKHVGNVKEEVRKAEGVVATARRYGYSTLAKQEEHLEGLKRELVQAEKDAETAQEQYKVAATALYQHRLGRDALRLAEIVAVAGSEPDQLFRADWSESYGDKGGRYVRVRFDLAQMDESGARVMETWTDREGVERSAPKIRFAFGCDIYGPRGTYGDKVEQATVSWSSFNGDADEAEAALRVHANSLRIAKFLNAIHEAWNAEDMAD
jgi:hypothetical protein